jgi:hypothetical protein
MTTITKEQAREQTVKFFKDNFAEHVERKVDRLLRCGALNLDSYRDDFRLPKILAYVIARSFADEIGVYDKKDIKEIKNLEIFV